MAKLVAARADQPFASVDDLWRRADVPTGTLVLMAEADAFLPSRKLARRDALWAIKALRDEALPLFAAVAQRTDRLTSEFEEPPVVLRPLTGGGEVVEDYVHLGLSLRSHPVAYLRDELQSHKIAPCEHLNAARDGKFLETAGIVLVRQRPGSAKGVMFITIEDETGIANLVIWPNLYEKQRRIILSSGMIAAYGQIQREGEVVHLVAHRLTDMSAQLAGIGDLTAAYSARHSRGVGAKLGSGPDSRAPVGGARGTSTAHCGVDGIKVKTRDSR